MEEIFKRELNILEILGLGINYFFKNLKYLFFITLVIYLPMNLINQAITEVSDNNPYINFANLLILLFIDVLGIMAIAVITENSINNVENNIKIIILKQLSNWGRAIITASMVFLISVGLCFLLVIPGIIAMVYYSFYGQIMALRNKFGKEAYRYSKSIIKKHWWKIFLLLAIVCSIGSIFAYLLKFIPHIFLLTVLFQTMSSLILTFNLIVCTIAFLNLEFIYENPIIINDINKKSEKILV